ncbi:MAG: hypothetical protein Q9186_000234 [Xanthomendoza sp. 1 TL-2023]
MIRDEQWGLDQVKPISQTQRPIKIMCIPEFWKKSDQAVEWTDDVYLAFAELSLTEVSMKSFDVGESFDVKFEPPAPIEEAEPVDEEAESNIYDDEQRTVKNPSWEAYIISNIDAYYDAGATGNLTFLLHRPKSARDRVIKWNDEASPNMVTELVYFIPQRSNLSARRLMNAVNAVHTGKSEKLTSLRQYLMGQSPTVNQPFDFFDIKQLLKSQATRARYLSVRQNKGPVDELIYKFAREAPWLMVVRYHSLHFERSATVKVANSRRSKRDTSDPKEDNANVSESTEADQTSLELRRAHALTISHARRVAKTNKSTRPHMGTRSLHAWILDAIDNQRTDEDPAITDFRRVFNGDPEADWGEPGYSKVYDTAQKNAEAYILGAASVVVATLSNCSDKFLAKHFHPDLGIIDEAANATEPELLVMVTNFIDNPEEIRVSTGLLKKVYAYYKAEKSVAHVKKDALPEELVNFTEARAFFASKCCLNCGQPGHRAKNCNLPRVVICRACDRPGHMSNACDDPNRKKQFPTCKKCGKRGHTAKDCQPVCVYCGKMGHDVPSCPTLPEDVLICFVCGKEGHNAKDCPDKPPAKHGPADANKAKADDWGATDASKAEDNWGTADASKAKADDSGSVLGTDNNMNWVNYAAGDSKKMEGNDRPAWMD